MKIIGLTGSIASGKTTVSNYFKSKNIKVIDADEITKNLYLDASVIYFIKKIFSNEILIYDKIDKKKIAQIIFNNKQKKQELENLLHPLVIKECKDKIEFYKKQNESLIILDAPLLIEANMLNMVDKVIVVLIDEKLEIKRLMARNNLSNSEAIKRINSQMPQSEKIKYADFIIKNNSSLDDLYLQIEIILKKIR